MAAYQVSYCDFETGRQVAADGTVRMDVGEIVDLMDEILTSAGCYVSVSDDDGNLIQFIVNDDDTICLDFPAPRKRGSYAKTSSLDECKAILRGLGDRIDAGDIPDLEFERW